MNYYTGGARGNGCYQPETCGAYVTIQGSVGPMGPEGPRGEQGERGETGAAGAPGERGADGETPVITVAEDTPRSYKLHFQTAAQELTTPNLFAPVSAYHADLSATGAVLNIPLGSLILTYQTTSSTALRITLAPKDTAQPVTADVRRTSIYQCQHDGDLYAQRRRDRRADGGGRHRLHQLAGDAQHAHPPAGPRQQALVAVRGEQLPLRRRRPLVGSGQMDRI